MTSIADKIQRLEELMSKARLGAKPIGLNVSLPTPAVCDIAGHMGFDYIIIDQEHTQIDSVAMLTNFVRAAELTGKPFFVKVNKADPLLIRDAMDLGAYGVMLPFIDSAQQMRDLITASQFPPAGNRGMCSLARAGGYATHPYTQSKASSDYVEFVNEHMIFIPTIESLDAVEELDEIISIPECQIFHIGFEDLAMSVHAEGLPPSQTLKLSRHISKRINEAGKLNMQFVIPDDDRGAALDAIDALGNDMLYIADSACLSFGCREGMRIAGASRERGSEQVKKSDAA